MSATSLSVDEFPPPAPSGSTTVQPMPVASQAALPTVLVVDDEPDIREAVSEVLTAEGYAVLEAANGQLALEVLENHPLPQVVLLDLMMPVMDGPTFLERLRADGRFVDLPVVVVTASDRSPEAAAILRKPFDLDELLATLARVIREG